MKIKLNLRLKAEEESEPSRVGCHFLDRLEAQDRLAASQTKTATAFVAVYKALGGGVPVTGAKP